MHRNREDILNRANCAVLNRSCVHADELPRPFVSWAFVSEPISAIQNGRNTFL
jgi:hypothetical protein